MAWTERQQAMLEAMGLRLWPRTPGFAVPAPAAGIAAPIAGAADAPAGERTDDPQGAPSASLRSPRAAVAGPAATGAVVARPQAAGLDWPALREAVARCRACRLCESRSQTVFGVGSEQAQWMVVGEAPGEQEDRQGEPFVGAAGQLLDRMLAALHLTRAADGPAPPSQRVYIANTLKCRPPRNRNPGADELAQCEPYLVRQIELLRPRIILAMGRFAVHSLLNTDEPIGRLRGRVHDYQGVPLVVTYHPAYLLRNLADKARAWDDLCLAARVADDAADAATAAAPV